MDEQSPPTPAEVELTKITVALSVLDESVAAMERALRIAAPHSGAAVVDNVRASLDEIRDARLELSRMLLG